MPREYRLTPLDRACVSVLTGPRGRATTDEDLRSGRRLPAWSLLPEILGSAFTLLVEREVEVSLPVTDRERRRLVGRLLFHGLCDAHFRRDGIAIAATPLAERLNREGRHGAKGKPGPKPRFTPEERAARQLASAHRSNARQRAELIESIRRVADDAPSEFDGLRAAVARFGKHSRFLNQLFGERDVKRARAANIIVEMLSTGPMTLRDIRSNVPEAKNKALRLAHYAEASELLRQQHVIRKQDDDRLVLEAP